MKYIPYYIFVALFLMENAIKSAEANSDTNGGFSLIGKRIVPSDNSYAKCLDSGCEARVYKKEFICMSEPYTTDAKSFFSDVTHKVDMIKVFSLRSGRTYEVLFSESDLVDD